MSSPIEVLTFQRVHSIIALACVAMVFCVTAAKIYTSVIKSVLNTIYLGPVNLVPGA